MNLKLILLLFPISLIGYTDKTAHLHDKNNQASVIPNPSQQNLDEEYNIANSFIDALLDREHLNNPESQENPNVTEFKLALKLFGEFSKSGNFICMNRIIIWLERTFDKFKCNICPDITQENQANKNPDNNKIYYSVLNEVGIACAAGPILYSSLNSRTDRPVSNQEEQEFIIKELDKSLIRYLKLLTKYGAKIDHVINNAGQFVGQDSQWSKINGTLLHIAASTNRDDLIDLLVSLNADPNLKDTNGRTALHIAIENCKNDEHSHVIEAIISKGGDVNAVYGDNIKPLKIALHKKLMKVAYILKQKGANQKRELEKAKSWWI